MCEEGLRVQNTVGAANTHGGIQGRDGGNCWRQEVEGVCVCVCLVGGGGGGVSGGAIG